VLKFKSSHIAQMGRLLTRLPRLSLVHNCGQRFDQLQMVHVAET